MEASRGPGPQPAASKDRSREHGDSRSGGAGAALVATAVDKCPKSSSRRRADGAGATRNALATALVTLAIFTFGRVSPPRLSALLIVSRDVEAAAPYKIDVAPGNATVPRGADQSITAKLSGFDSDQAAIMVRKSPEAPFERLPLVKNESHQFDGMLFDLAGPVDYFVEAGGVKSPVFKLSVVDLPYVKQLELEYHFPAYTGLPPQKIEDGGDIAVSKAPRSRRHADDRARGRSC